MKSRYIARVEARLADTVVPSDRGMLIGEIAFHHARLGNKQQVEGILVELREATLKSGSGVGQAICWANIAEGILYHYDGQNSAARSKWERSRAVADSLGLRRISAVASAWLTFSYYLTEQLQQVVKNSILTIEQTDSDNYSSVSRLSLSIALCLHYVGRIPEARRWYTSCRLAAVNDGDEATLAALIHSMAWMSASSSRSCRSIEASQSPQKDLLLIKSETVESYESLVGAKHLPALTPLLRAQEHIISGNYSAAIELIDTYARSAAKDGFGRLAPGLLADRAYCLARLGFFSDAATAAKHAHESSREGLHGDDLYVFNATMSKVFLELGISDAAESYGAQAMVAWEALVGFREAMSSAIDEVCAAAKKCRTYAEIVN